MNKLSVCIAGSILLFALLNGEAIARDHDHDHEHEHQHEHAHDHDHQHGGGGHADGHGLVEHHDHQSRSHGGSSGLYFGLSVPYTNYPYYDTYLYNNYPPEPPPVYIQQQPQPIYPAIPPAPVVQQGYESGYWYYCSGSKAYYPYVKTCSGGWQKVSPVPE